jgi:hypothetical protein
VEEALAAGDGKVPADHDEVGEKLGKSASYLSPSSRK